MRQHTDLVADHDNKMKTLQDQVTELERLYNVAQQDAAVARDENRRLSEAAGAAEKQLAALQSALAGDAHWAALFAEIRKLEPTWAPGDAFQAAARVAMELTLPAPEYGADEPL